MRFLLMIAFPLVLFSLNSFAAEADVDACAAGFSEPKEFLLVGSTFHAVRGLEISSIVQMDSKKSGRYGPYDNVYRGKLTENMTRSMNLELRVEGDKAFFKPRGIESSAQVIELVLIKVQNEKNGLHANFFKSRTRTYAAKVSYSTNIGYPGLDRTMLLIARVIDENENAPNPGDPKWTPMGYAFLELRPVKEE